MGPILKSAPGFEKSCKISASIMGYPGKIEKTFL
jgi:hypothetical protein